MYYLFLLLSVVLLSLQFAVNKFYQKEMRKVIVGQTYDRLFLHAKYLQ